MLQLDDTEFSPAECSSLFWRWNSAGHVEFSKKQLDEIRTVSLQASQRIHDQLLQLDLQSTSSAAVSELGDEGIADWLKKTLSAHTEVLLSWDKGTSIVVTTSLFSQHWDDFCYSSSDDIFIAPLSLDWVMEYHHYDVFSPVSYTHLTLPTKA